MLAPHAEELGLPQGVDEALRSAARTSQMAGMATAARTVRVATALENAGVRHLVLKGVALAHQTTGSPIARGAGDVDILVAPTSVAAAVDALEATGMKLDADFAPSPRSPLFPATLRTQQELVVLDGAVEIDVHWRLDGARACLAWTFDELYEQRQMIGLAGAGISTLGPVAAVIFNASSGTRDGWSRLRALVDHVRLMQPLDQVEVLAEAARVGARRRMELALGLAALLLDDTPFPRDQDVARLVRRMWSRLELDESPHGRLGAVASARALGDSVLTHDSPRAALQRSATLVWPVRDMAARRLGDTGDRHAWLYAAGTPYFLSRRAMVKLGVLPAGR